MACSKPLTAEAPGRAFGSRQAGTGRAGIGTGFDEFSSLCQGQLFFQEATYGRGGFWWPLWGDVAHENGVGQAFSDQQDVPLMTLIFIPPVQFHCAVPLFKEFKWVCLFWGTRKWLLAFEPQNRGYLKQTATWFEKAG